MKQPWETINRADDLPFRLSGFTMSFPSLYWQTAARVMRTIGFEHIDLVVGNPLGPATDESWYFLPERVTAAPVAEGERARAFLSALGVHCANVQVFLPTQLNTPKSRRPGRVAPRL